VSDQGAATATRESATRRNGSTSSAPTQSGPPSGSIKWFNARKGFGFIERPDGDDVFVHCSALESGYKRLKEGQRVEFELRPGRKGDEASNVRVLVS
jgi:CspA family cold shock protein